MACLCGRVRDTDPKLLNDTGVVHYISHSEKYAKEKKRYL